MITIVIGRVSIYPQSLHRARTVARAPSIPHLRWVTAVCQPGVPPQGPMRKGYLGGPRRTWRPNRWWDPAV